MRFEINEIDANSLGERKATYSVECFTPEEECELKEFLMAHDSEPRIRRIRRIRACDHLQAIPHTHDVVSAMQNLTSCCDSNIFGEKANPSIKPFIVINREKKTVVFKNSENTFKVKCQEDDEFNVYVGVGLCIGRVYKNSKSIQFLKNKLDYKEFADYCFKHYFDFDKSRIEKFIETIINTEDNKQIALGDY